MVGGYFLDRIQSAGRTKARKETQKLAWKIFTNKCEAIIREHPDPKGIPLHLLLLKSEVSLWTFNKYKPMILQVHPSITFNKKTKRYIYKNPVT